jgi:hypothetical protein
LILISHLVDVALEEIVQSSPDRGDGCELPDVLPGWGNRRFDDVGRELERQTYNEPSRET